MTNEEMRRRVHELSREAERARERLELANRNQEVIQEYRNAPANLGTYQTGEFEEIQLIPVPDNRDFLGAYERYKRQRKSDKLHAPDGKCICIEKCEN